MDTKHWTALLRLMSLMVVVDGRVREEEIRVFVYRMLELHRRLAPEMMFSEGMVRDWFATHAEEIDALDDAGRAEMLDGVLAELGDLGMGAEIVDAINAVSRADGYRHDTELALIGEVAGRWGVAVPRR